MYNENNDNEDFLNMNKLERLKYLRILQEDGSFYGDIPLAIDARNVSMQNKFDLQSTVGDINYKEELLKTKTPIKAKEVKQKEEIK